MIIPDLIMKKARIVILILALVLLVVNMYSLDYENLQWSNNRSGYLGIISMSLIAVGMILSNWHEKKKQRNEI